MIGKWEQPSNSVVLVKLLQLAIGAHEMSGAGWHPSTSPPNLILLSSRLKVPESNRAFAATTPSSTYAPNAWLEKSGRSLRLNIKPSAKSC
jgi:hypothetical protein